MQMDDLEPYATLIRNSDPAIFTVETQTGPGDQASLLAIQNLIRQKSPGYIYLEVGSHLGGTLLPHLVDPNCRQVFSVDKRPPFQLDERGVYYDYLENSTENMLATISQHAPPAALCKLWTFDCATSELTARAIDDKVNLAFIDAEHTNVAVVQDFMNIRKFLADSYIVAFHDADLLFDGLQNIECFLRHTGTEFASFFLPETVYTLVVGSLREIAVPALGPLSVDRASFIHGSRIALWREIAGNVNRIEGNAIGHQLP